MIDDDHWELLKIRLTVSNQAYSKEDKSTFINIDMRTYFIAYSVWFIETELTLDFSIEIVFEYFTVKECLTITDAFSSNDNYYNTYCNVLIKYFSNSPYYFRILLLLLTSIDINLNKIHVESLHSKKRKKIHITSEDFKKNQCHKSVTSFYTSRFYSSTFKVDWIRTKLNLKPNKVQLFAKTMRIISTLCVGSKIA